MAACVVGCGNNATDANGTAGVGTSGGAAPMATAGSSHGGMPQAGGGAGGSGDRAGSSGTGSGGPAGGDSGAGRSGATGGSGAAAGSAASGGLGTAGSSASSGGAGGMAGTGPSSGGFGPGMLTLSNLKIEANPSMTLSCFVSWTTAEAAASEVDFGETDYAFRIRDAALVTEHKLLVIGMHAEKPYKIRAVSGNAQGSGSLEGTFTTGKLPSGLPTATVNIDELPAEQRGWTLTNIQTSSFSAPALAVMYDEKGIPVWYFVQGKSGDTRGDVATELLPSNTVLVGPTSGEPGREVDLSGKILWEGPANSTTQLMSHFVGKTSKGNYLLNYELDKAGTSGSTKVDDQRLVELTPKNEVAWSWTLFDHIEPAGTKEELCHGNMLVLDEANDIMYYNCRWIGLLKIDRKTGEVLWRLGGTYDKTSLGPGDFTFSPAASQYSDTHEPEFHADGTILFYDNGGYAMGAGGGNYHSRIVEYKVDETAKTATLTFEFPGTFSGVDSWYKSNWYSPFWGDVDQLANGNILVTAPVKSASASTRFFEVTRQGKVVWELELPPNNGSFKAQRLLPPPLVEPMP